MIWKLTCLLSFPWVLAHEMTHYAIARTRTDDAAFEAEVFDARARAVWDPLDSRFWRAFAFLAPTVFGSVLALLWLLTGVSLEGWRLLFAVGLAFYTVPSPADIQGALGKQPAQKQ